MNNTGPASMTSVFGQKVIQHRTQDRTRNCGWVRLLIDSLTALGHFVVLGLELESYRPCSATEQFQTWIMNYLEFTHCWATFLNSKHNSTGKRGLNYIQYSDINDFFKQPQISESKFKGLSEPRGWQWDTVAEFHLLLLSLSDFVSRTLVSCFIFGSIAREGRKGALRAENWAVASFPVSCVCPSKKKRGVCCRLVMRIMPWHLGWEMLRNRAL